VEPAKQRAPKVRKAAPKRRRGRKKTPVEITADFLAGIALFKTLEPELRALIAPNMMHLDVERGEVLVEGPPLDDDASSVFLLLRGDVAIHRTVAGKTVIANYLSVGEPYIQKLFMRTGTEALRLETMCPVRVIKMPYRDMNYVMRKSPAFREAFGAAIRPVSQRGHARFDSELQSEIAQFIVDQRLTFAGRIKIKRMDLCIECDGCYDACRSRHGTDRLGANEVKFGLTEIPQNCHSCVVPECLDKCKFGHLSRHPKTGEITIADDCVGCTMCARGCSFGAIRMHPVAELDMGKFFPDRKPDHKGLNIAQKCDNCSDYADQACVSACPAGALFQVDGGAVFEYWEQFNVHKQPGAKGIVSPERTAQTSQRFWRWFALVQIVLVTWEIVSRLWWPSASFTGLFHRFGWLAEGVDLHKPLTAGGLFGHTIGYMGAVGFIGAELYRVGKAYAPRLGSMQAWMASHIWLGTLGGVYGFYHTAFIWREPIAVATFGLAMVAIFTGGLGRFLLYLVPRSQAGKQLALQELQAQIQTINEAIETSFHDRRVGYTMMTRAMNLEATADTDDDGLAHTRLLPGIVRVLGEDRQQRKDIDALGPELEQDVQEGQADEVLRLLKEKARLERSTRLHGFLARILKRYRVVHVVSSNILMGALLLHIVRSLMYLVG
jgi:Fe-S-cluster-containing hydrogenase component 2